jgi:polygalacturonase
LLKEWDDQSPNTDGIDPTASQRVLIRHCRIDTGDDCIAIKANSGALTQDILITDCTFLHGNGCTIGSGERGGLRNMTVRRCTFDGTAVGMNLESARDRGNLIENITYADLTMRNVGEAIIITNYYPNGARIERPYSGRFIIDLVNGGHDDPQPVTATTLHWRNITVRNVTATCIWEAGLILGLPEMPVEKLVLDHVKIEAPEGLHIGYAKDILLRNVTIKARNGSSLLVSDTVEGLKGSGGIQ